MLSRKVNKKSKWKPDYNRADIYDKTVSSRVVYGVGSYLYNDTSESFLEYCPNKNRDFIRCNDDCVYTSGVTINNKTLQLNNSVIIARYGKLIEGKVVKILDYKTVKIQVKTTAVYIRAINNCYKIC